MTSKFDPNRRDWESPNVLTDGAWQIVRGVLRWVPNTEPQESSLNVAGLIACPTCHAKVDQLCRTKSGRHRMAHANRIVAKRCFCGAALEHNARLCRTCRDDARRENGRRGMQNTRARRRAEKEAA